MRAGSGSEERTGWNPSLQGAGMWNWFVEGRLVAADTVPGEDRSENRGGHNLYQYRDHNPHILIYLRIMFIYRTFVVKS